jgi:diaminohydroxyphosphoribosylaminopyrimidine deaminase/5-amino-6-(5-phosphoribosylamino)uracil reductase
MNPVADLRYMDTALAMAWAQLGRTSPNPAVGCVLVRDGQIIATGATADGGRPHAERQALDKAGARASGCTAYVTLEPCAFHGQTPPCASGLIEAGIVRVVIATIDRHPKVSGRGVQMLEDAGIAVETGLCADRSDPLYAGFFNRLATGLPQVYIDDNSAIYDHTLSPQDAKDPIAHLAQLGARGFNRINILNNITLDQSLKKLLDQQKQ